MMISPGMTTSVGAVTLSGSTSPAVARLLLRIVSPFVSMVLFVAASA